MVESVNSRVSVQQAATKKNSNLGTKVGAGVGLAAGVVNGYLRRNALDEYCKQMVESGASKNMAKFSKGFGLVAGIAIFTGLGALAGKGVQKLVEHFKKDEAKTPTDPLAPRTVKTKKDGEFVIQPGHPKTVYKKNPQTGELEFVTQVYDGSWGKEMSDKDLIKVLTQKV